MNAYAVAEAADALYERPYAVAPWAWWFRPVGALTADEWYGPYATEAIALDARFEAASANVADGDNADEAFERDGDR